MFNKVIVLLLDPKQTNSLIVYEYIHVIPIV